MPGKGIKKEIEKKKKAEQSQKHSCQKLVKSRAIMLIPWVLRVSEKRKSETHAYNS